MGIPNQNSEKNSWISTQNLQSYTISESISYKSNRPKENQI